MKWWSKASVSPPMIQLGVYKDRKQAIRLPLSTLTVADSYSTDDAAAHAGEPHGRNLNLWDPSGICSIA